MHRVFMNVKPKLKEENMQQWVYRKGRLFLLEMKSAGFTAVMVQVGTHFC